MSLTAIKLENFTAFKNLKVKFSPGVNIFIGENGTGKTHLMKAAYAACNAAKKRRDFGEELISLFLPDGRIVGRLAKRQRGKTTCTVEVFRRKSKKIRASFSNQANKARITSSGIWSDPRLKSVYVPVKEMLSNAPGFRSLYAERELHFESVYDDILARAFLPTLRGRKDVERKKLLRRLAENMYGKVILRGETFFLKNREGNLEFTLLAEGMRKLGLLYRLIENGTLAKGSVLFWDEPETNLNPKMFHNLVEIFLELQRSGVQIFLATHEYCILKEFDLQTGKKDEVFFHSLFRQDDSEIACHTTSSYLQISPNTIADTFDGLYDRQVARSIGAKK